MKKPFFTNREDPILPTPPVRVLHASLAGALAARDTRSLEPAGPAGETEAGAVTVWVNALPTRAGAPSHQPHFEQVAP